MFLTPFHKKKESDKKKRIWQKPQKEERIYYASQLKEKQPILVGGIAKGKATVGKQRVDWKQ